MLGAIINANIFGELVVIVASMGRAEKLFQSKYASINTALINLNLERNLAQDVRNEQIRNAPSKQSQVEEIQLLQTVSPSLKMKIVKYKYV